VFTRFHPLLENATVARTFGVAPQDAHAPSTSVKLTGQTVSIDCRGPEEAATKSYARVLRQEIAAGRRAGLHTEHDVAWRDQTAFVDLYQATMTRLRAHPRYHLSKDDVDRFRVALGDHVHLLVTRQGDRFAAAGLFTELGGIVQAHLIGTAVELRSLSPQKILFDDAREWAHRRGAHTLHLGGGFRGRDDTLMAFKRRFSARRHPFHTGRWILDRDRYDELVDRVPAGSSPSSDFFPAYRSAHEAAPARRSGAQR
jgi:hypothetical protein